MCLNEYDFLMDIISILENRIENLESYLIDSLNAKFKMNADIIEFIDIKLTDELNKNDELKQQILLLEKKIKEQDDELYSIKLNKKIIDDELYSNSKNIEFTDIKLTNELNKNDELKQQILLLEKKIKEQDDDLYSISQNNIIEDYLNIKSKDNILTIIEEDLKKPSNDYIYIKLLNLWKFKRSNLIFPLKITHGELI